MQPPNDAIVRVNPQLGSALAVIATDGSEIDCGEVLECGYLVVNRDSGQQLIATMILVRTTIFPKGFRAYPDPSLPTPEQYRSTLQRNLYRFTVYV